MKMQDVSESVWESVSYLLPFGSYTANEVYDKLSDLSDEIVCKEEVSIEVDTFRCCTPKYIFFRILHKFEQLAGLGKKKKKFIKEASSSSCDVFFVVDITKQMASLSRIASKKENEIRPAINRVAIDYNKGYVVSTDGRILNVMKADISQLTMNKDVNKWPVLVFPSTFKSLQGKTSVSIRGSEKIDCKYSLSSADGSYYEQVGVGRYPDWQSVVPNALFRNGRVSLAKDAVKLIKQFAKEAEKYGDKGYNGIPMVAKTENRTLTLSYRRENNEQYRIIKTENELETFTIALNAEHFKYMDAWNGTMWLTARDKCVIYDKENETDYYLAMPMSLPDDVNSIGTINGTKVDFDARHTEYRKTQKNKTATKKETKNNNPKKQIFMAAERYEGTEAFYSLEQIENGEFRVKGNKHDSDLVLFLRTAAHYIRRQGQKMQSEFCDYCSKQMEGKDWRSLVPMEELALAEMFEGFLASKGVDDIPDVEFEDIVEEAESEAEPQGRATIDIEPIEEDPNGEPDPDAVGELVYDIPEEVEEVEAEEVVEEPQEPQSYVFCITGTLDKSRKFYQEQIEMRGWRLASKMSTSVDILVYGESKDEQASVKVKQAIKHGTKAISAKEFYQMLAEHPIEAEEVVEPTEVSVKPMAIEREIVPTLELETTDGVLIIAGESYFQKLYDEENGCFRSEAAEAKFNEIDAFIADELILADVLDYAAISDAVCEFMKEVEQAS